MPTDKQILDYMLENIQDNIDPLTGEVNCTFLAEDAADHFNEYEDGYEIPEFYFELAQDAEDQYNAEKN